MQRHQDLNESVFHEVETKMLLAFHQYINKFSLFENAIFSEFAAH